MDDTWYLRLREIAQFVAVNYVDIALIKFSKPSFSRLGRFAAPNFLNLVPAEWKRQFPFSHRHVTRKRYCQIEMQRSLYRSFVIVGSQSCKSVDLLFHATLGGQDLFALRGRRFNRHKTEELEVSSNDLDEPIELKLLLREVFLIEAPQ